MIGENAERRAAVLDICEIKHSGQCGDRAGLEKTHGGELRELIRRDREENRDNY